jgi:hypothetical protein
MRAGTYRYVSCTTPSMTWKRLSRTSIVVSCATSPVPVPTLSPTTPAPSGTTPPATATSAPPSSTSGSGAPAGGIAKVFGSSALAGPSSAPAGAVTVGPAQILGDVVSAHAAGTTYWLAPGTYHLGTGQFDQVQPKSGDTFIGAPGAVIDGQHKNLYAFVGDATGVTVRNLTIQNFGSAGDNSDQGVMNHDSATDWTMSALTLQHNAGAATMLGSSNRLENSCLLDNGQYGFNAYSSEGITNLVMSGNEITGNNTDDWETQEPGCGCTGGGKFWAVVGATVTGNYVHDNRGVGLWADTNNSGFLFQGNYISNNDAVGLMYETSYNAAILGNTFVGNAVKEGPTNPGFPSGAIYISESGSDRRAPGPYGDVFKISGNTFTNNWSGVVAWENADRFAGSPANTSSGATTLVNPAATVKACSTPSLIATKPYVDDCQWKTQNLQVTGNTFTLDPSTVPGCTAAKGCGFNGVFSQYGTYPSWSPFKAYVVPDNISLHQNNVWQDNTYQGPWGFMAREMGSVVSWDTWRSTYHEEAGSSLG